MPDFKETYYEQFNDRAEVPESEQPYPNRPFKEPMMEMNADAIIAKMKTNLQYLLNKEENGKVVVKCTLSGYETRARHTFIMAL